MSARTQNLGLVALALVGSISLAYAMTGCKEMGSAHASSIIDVSDGRPILALADGSAAVEAAPVAAPTAPEPNVLHDLSKLRDAYEALKANKDKSAKTLLLVALLAIGLKVLLDIVNIVLARRPKKWLKWVAISLAVPIALLSHYALGFSLFDSLIWAGAGPGAVIVHELVKHFGKSKGGK